MHPHPFCFHLTPSYSLRTPPSLYYFFPFIFSADLFLLPVRIHRRANVVVLVALNVPLRCPSFFFFLSFPFFSFHSTSHPFIPSSFCHLGPRPPTSPHPPASSLFFFPLLRHLDMSSGCRWCLQQPTPSCVYTLLK